MERWRNDYPDKILINIGTLVLDMYDSERKQLVWTGHASKTLEPTGSREQKRRVVDVAVTRLLKDFPPRGR